MIWNKKGLIYAPETYNKSGMTHAMCPTPLLVGDGRIRVYFSAHDSNMAGRLFYVELDVEDPTRILTVSDTPPLDIGADGQFDDNGVVPISIVRVGDEIWLYYAGFQLGVKIRYTIFSGLAISRDGGLTFERHSEVPILDRSPGESLLRSAPSVVHEDDGGFRMWYIASDEHILAVDRLRPKYDIRCIASADGIDWPRNGQTAVPLVGDDEYGLGRPHVVKGDQGYHMWYSIRRLSMPYRLGYAFSPDGHAWERKDDQIGLTVSDENDWDSEMVYANSVIATPAGTYMFYNGNDYGRTGFGYALLDGSL
tara:strand:+ start:61690 stop:62616 length:927 start_codon:yes stop_codon:yes gene_type:complete